jgi:hypothetical protein
MRSDPLGLFYRDLTVEDAFFHYFFGGGTLLTVGFDQVDIGLQPRDFPGYAEDVQSMYKKVGTRGVNRIAPRDVSGWAGNLEYTLGGFTISDSCKWKFEGATGGGICSILTTSHGESGTYGKSGLPE